MIDAMKYKWICNHRNQRIYIIQDTIKIQIRMVVCIYIPVYIYS